MVTTNDNRTVTRERKGKVCSKQAGAACAFSVLPAGPLEARSMTRKQVPPEVTELRKRLRIAGVSLSQIAVRLGCSQPNVSQQFRGTRPLQPKTVDAARALMWERVQTLMQDTNRVAGELRDLPADAARIATK